MTGANRDLGGPARGRGATCRSVGRTQVTGEVSRRGKTQGKFSRRSEEDQLKKKS